MKRIVLLVLNTVSLLFTLIVNYLTTAGTSGRPSVGEISAKYENLFTPAGYAFAIWGLIYLFLMLFAGYQWFAWLKNRNREYIDRTGIWFLVSNLANGFWIFAWTGDNPGLAFALISILLFSLVVLMFRLRIEVWDAPVGIIAFVWWPICIYLGWIVVAALANLAAWSVSISPVSAFALKPFWVIVLIAFAMVVYILLVYYRNMREAAFVGIWALVAIAVKQWHASESVAYAALGASFVLFASSLWQASKNLETMPFKKIKRGEF